MKLKVTSKLPRVTETLREWARQELNSKVIVGLPVQPFEGASPMRCGQNVEMACRALGGRVAVGYLLWDNYGLAVTSEHHIAWETPDGTLIDPTPQDGARRVLFADTQRRIEIGSDEYMAFVRVMTEEHLQGDNNPYLIVADHPKVHRLIAEVHHEQLALNHYKNRHFAAGQPMQESVVEGFWTRIDRLYHQLENFAKAKPKDSAKRRARRKSERQRRRKQRLLARR